MSGHDRAKESQRHCSIHSWAPQLSKCMAHFYKAPDFNKDVCRAGVPPLLHITRQEKPWILACNRMPLDTNHRPQPHLSSWVPLTWRWRTNLIQQDSAFLRNSPKAMTKSLWKSSKSVQALWDRAWKMTIRGVPLAGGGCHLVAVDGSKNVHTWTPWFSTVQMLFSWMMKLSQCNKINILQFCKAVGTFSVITQWLCFSFCAAAASTIKSQNKTKICENGLITAVISAR